MFGSDLGSKGAGASVAPCVNGSCGNLLCVQLGRWVDVPPSVTSDDRADKVEEDGVDMVGMASSLGSGISAPLLGLLTQEESFAQWSPLPGCTLGLGCGRKCFCNCDVRQLTGYHSFMQWALDMFDGQTSFVGWFYMVAMHFERRVRAFMVSVGAAQTILSRMPEEVLPSSGPRRGGHTHGKLPTPTRFDCGSQDPGHPRDLDPCVHFICTAEPGGMVPYHVSPADKQSTLEQVLLRNPDKLATFLKRMGGPENMQRLWLHEEQKTLVATRYHLALADALFLTLAVENELNAFQGFLFAGLEQVHAVVELCRACQASSPDAVPGFLSAFLPAGCVEAGEHGSRSALAMLKSMAQVIDETSDRLMRDWASFGASATVKHLAKKHRVALSFVGFDNGQVLLDVKALSEKLSRQCVKPFASALAALKAVNSLHASHATSPPSPTPPTPSPSCAACACDAKEGAAEKNMVAVKSMLDAWNSFLREACVRHAEVGYTLSLAHANQAEFVEVRNQCAISATFSGESALSLSDIVSTRRFCMAKHLSDSVKAVCLCLGKLFSLQNMTLKAMNVAFARKGMQEGLDGWPSKGPTPLHFADASDQWVVTGTLQDFFVHVVKGTKGTQGIQRMQGTRVRAMAKAKGKGKSRSRNTIQSKTSTTPGVRGTTGSSAGAEPRKLWPVTCPPVAAVPAVPAVPDKGISEERPVGQRASDCSDCCACKKVAHRTRCGQGRGGDVQHERHERDECFPGGGEGTGTVAVPKPPCVMAADARVGACMRDLRSEFVLFMDAL